jgi:hypothetical protein
MNEDFLRQVEAMNEEFMCDLNAAGRNLAMTLMLKALFGIVEHSDSTFSATAVRAALEEKLAELLPPDPRGMNAVIREGAMDAIEEILV